MSNEPSHEEQLDALCDRFEADVLAGKSPQIEVYLTEIREEAQAELFEELLRVEIHHRTEAGKIVRQSDYRKRFPLFGELITRLIPVEQPALDETSVICIRCPHCHQGIELLPEESFQDVTCDSCGSNFNLLSDTETLPQQTGAGQMIGHFQLKERLGTGAFGTVWKATDTTLDRTVACKIP
ncbi:MAG: hypothetical protein KDA80_22060 [Planctomycetaceae bacterium]|nr:hypothetical protein [Planctomycetaceae bacterium]